MCVCVCVCVCACARACVHAICECVGTCSCTFVWVYTCIVCLGFSERERETKIDNRGKRCHGEGVSEQGRDQRWREWR